MGVRNAAYSEDLKSCPTVFGIITFLSTHFIECSLKLWLPGQCKKIVQMTVNAMGIKTFPSSCPFENLLNVNIESLLHSKLTRSLRF